jgi:hypothetical protein
VFGTRLHFVPTTSEQFGNGVHVVHGVSKSFGDGLHVMRTGFETVLDGMFRRWKGSEEPQNGRFVRVTSDGTAVGSAKIVNNFEKRPEAAHSRIGGQPVFSDSQRRNGNYAGPGVQITNNKNQ